MQNCYLKKVTGCLLGTAVGDALGLPYEGLSRKKIKRSYIPITGHRLILNKGMFSDDTEHACMTAQSLIIANGDTIKFSRDFAWRFRLWFLGIPAGIGLATLKSAFKLWIGFPPHKSGVNSAGNGPAMRSTIIGVCYGKDPSELISLVRASTIISHNSVQAQLGAIAVAVAAYISSIQTSIEPSEYLQTLKQYLLHPSTNLSNNEIVIFLDLIEQACTSAEKKETGATFTYLLGNNCGVSGYIYHTVPIVIQVWLRNQDNYAQGIKEIIYLGGDTDTTAAILGGIIGASVGISGIPQDWLDNIVDYPRSVKWIKSLSKRLAIACESKSPHAALPLAFLWIPLRNFIFLIVVLLHVCYRFLPF